MKTLNWTFKLLLCLVLFSGVLILLPGLPPQRSGAQARAVIQLASSAEPVAPTALSLPASASLAALTAPYCTPPLCLDWSSIESDNTYSVAWGDYDGDGDLDLAVGNNGPNRLYRNDGAPGFAPAFTLVWSSAESDNTTSMAWGDYDGDGDVDLVVGNEGSNRLYRNDTPATGSGPAAFTLVWSSSESDDTRSVAWGDVDGDGDLDLAVGNYRVGEYGQPNRLYRNDTPANGSGPAIFTLVWSSTESDNTRSVAWGDYDGDGDLDLAVGNAPVWNDSQGEYVGGENRLYRNDGVAGAAPTLTLVWSSAESDWTTSVAWGDVDGDGDLDLAVGNGSPWPWDGQPNRLYRNDGGTLVLVWSSTESDWTTSVAWGDMDGDGDLDLAVGNGSSWELGAKPNRLYRNDGGVITPALTLVWSSPESDWTTSVAWGDVDADGDLDLAVGNAGYGVYQQPNRLYRNESGTMTAGAVWSSTESDNTYSVAWGDSDGDGDLDLAVGNRGQPNRLYRNDGGVIAPTLTLVWSSTESAWTASVAWGDYDGDGDLDLVAGNFGQPNHLYRNDNGMLTTSAVYSTTESDNTTSVAWGDYDGDGDLDLAVGNSNNQPNRLYRNEGGTLTPVWSSTESDNSYSVAWGDYDGDGDLDLAVGNYGQPNRLYRNDNGALTTSAVYSTTESDNTTSVAWGDYDGDGDLDLAVANYGQPNRLYRNDNGALTLVWSSTESDATNSVAWGDSDGDGDLDLAVGNYRQPRRLYRNDGGTLTANAVWSSTESYWTFSVAWGDVDADGDLDLAVGNEGRNHLYRNTRDGRPFAGTVPAPGLTQLAPLFNANFVYTNPVSRTAIISIPYTLSDPEGDRVRAIRAFYSPDGGGQWHPAQAASGTLTQNLATAGAALDLDGVDDYVHISNPITLTNASFTLAVWARRDTVGTAGIILGQGTGNTNLGLHVGFRGSNVFTCAFWANDLNTPSTYTDTGWHHWTCTYNAATKQRTLYRDGLQVAQDTAAANYQGSGSLQMGAFAAIPSIHFKGALDEVRVYTRELSPVEVATLAGGGEPAATDLVGYWPLNEGKGLIAHDQTLNHNDGALVNGPHWVWTRVQTPIFRWDTFASGFFGQSDNVVFRIVTYPSLKPTINGAPVFQRPSTTAASMPFRVRGTQVRVISDTVPTRDAVVYRLPAGQSSGGEPLTNNAGQPYRTDDQGYLQGRGQLALGEQLVALLPITATEAYTLYYTSAAPSTTGLTATTVLTPGVQVLTITAANPLLLFNLDVSLEWDARNDGNFISDLEYAVQQASAVLYDVSDGQAALGEVHLHQNKANWVSSDIVVYAQNGIRPRASMGGVVDDLTDDWGVNGVISNAYGPGQVRMGPNWDPFGQNLAELSVDWQRALAHELAHYLLYLPDNYLGVQDGFPVSIDCKGSFMTSTYDDAYSELLTAAGWITPCTNSVAAHTTGRTDWQTVQRFYTMLHQPAAANLGPSTLPLAVTHLRLMEPATPAATLAPAFFDLRDAATQDLLPVRGAYGYIFQTRNTPTLTDDAVIALGATVGDGDRLKVRGAEPGDRLCIFGPYDATTESAYAGCVPALALNDRSIPLTAVANWRPTVIVQAVTSRTLHITATLAVSESALHVQVFPAYGAPGVTALAAPTAAMQPVDATGRVFTQVITLDAPAFEGFVRVWVPGATPLREALSQVYLSPPWGPNSGGGWINAAMRAWGANARQLGAPVASGDGQVTIFNLADLFAETGTLSLQTLTDLPDLPAWLTSVGQGYRFVAEGVFPRVLSFDYLQRDVPAGYEHTLAVYYQPEGRIEWQRLPTTVDAAYNRASARMPDNAVNSQGLYALIATIELPPFVAGWNNFGYPVPETRPVTTALASLEDAYTAVFVYQANTAQWRVYDRTVPPEFAWLVNDLTHLEFGKGYWLYATRAITGYMGVPANRPLATTGFELPPAIFYGQAVAGPTFTPSAGMTITAWINGVECGRTTVTPDGDAWLYAIQVRGEDVLAPGTCGAVGRTVTFQAGGQPVGMSWTWHNRQAWYNPLSDRAVVFTETRTLNGPGTYTFGDAYAQLTFADGDDLGALETITVTQAYTFPTVQGAPRPLPRTYVITGNVATGFTATLSLCYDEGDMLRAGIPFTRETDLQAYRYAGNGVWDAYLSAVDAAANRVTATVHGFSVWAIGASTGGHEPTAISVYRLRDVSSHRWLWASVLLGAALWCARKRKRTV